MADNNELLLRLLSSGLTQTECIDIPLVASKIAKPLASKGMCKAVVLRLNEYDINTETQTDAPYFYVGDKTFQTIEVLRGINSQVFFIDDLSEIYLRYPVLNGRATSITVRVMIYN